MRRFEAEDLAVSLGAATASQGSSSKTCEGAVCECGDTCTNVTNPAKKIKPIKKSHHVASADVDVLVAQLRELTPVG